MQRPARFQLNRNHPLARGLKFAWLGYLPGGSRSFSSDSNRVTGTKSGDACWTYSPDLRRYYQDFDGTGDYITLDETLDRFAFVQNTHVFSISFWVKFDAISTGSLYGILGNSNSNTVKGLIVACDGNASGACINVYTTDGASIGGMNRTAYGSITTGVWYHVVIAGYRAAGTNYNTAQFYINGLAVTSTRVLDRKFLGTGNCTRVTLLGAYNSSTGASNPMDGKLADVLIWDRTLGPSDAWQLSRPDPMIGGLIEPIASRIYAYAPEAVGGYAHSHCVIC